jgi:hypothetical protein
MKKIACICFVLTLGLLLSGPATAQDACPGCAECNVNGFEVCVECDNCAVIEQQGCCEYCDPCGGNFAVQLQENTYHASARIRQIQEEGCCGENFALQYQNGDDLCAVIEQYGPNNCALQVQVGMMNAARIVQDTTYCCPVPCDGIGNAALQMQFGDNLCASICQTGLGNTAIQIQADDCGACTIPDAAAAYAAGIPAYATIPVM